MSINIVDFGNIPNITHQITTATPQAGFRCDPSAVVTSDNSTSAPLLRLNLSDRKGYQQDYSIEDAATSLWKKENLTFNLNDPASFDRWVSRLQSGGGNVSPTVAELSAYIDQLRQTGLDGTVDWSGLEKEFTAFQTTTPDELADALDYLASRYVAALDKLERNYSGNELAEQTALLESAYQTGTAGLIDGYTQLLQSNLGISDTGEVKDSFVAILEQKVNAYRGALEQVNQSVADTGAGLSGEPYGAISRV